LAWTLDRLGLAPVGMPSKQLVHFSAQFHELLNTSAFLEALPAFLPPDQASQQRLPDLLATLRAITDLAEP
jgi:hypothetical protein